MCYRLNKSQSIKTLTGISTYRNQRAINVHQYDCLSNITLTFFSCFVRQFFTIKIQNFETRDLKKCSYDMLKTPAFTFLCLKYPSVLFLRFTKKILHTKNSSGTQLWYGKDNSRNK